MAGYIALGRACPSKFRCPEGRIRAKSEKYWKPFLMLLKNSLFGDRGCWAHRPGPCVPFEILPSGKKNPGKIGKIFETVLDVIEK
jgi:hypothetical protein